MRKRKAAIDAADTVAQARAEASLDKLKPSWLSTDYASRGPQHLALVNEVRQARADREAAVAAREAFARTEADAIAQDDIPTLVLGESLQEAFAARMRAVDDDLFAAQLRQAQTLG